MKSIALALALTFPADDRSLGIGIDVFPEAYGFAASKNGFVPGLRLRACRATDCRWTLGNAISLTASFPEERLNILRIEAELSSGVEDDASEARFRETCLTIVTLMQPELLVAERQAVAAAIATPVGRSAEVEASRSYVPMTFYGQRTSGRSDFIARCGVAAEGADPR